MTITPLPGASALLAALTLAGLPADGFYFAGFLPQKDKEQAALFSHLSDLPATLIFYEAPHRLLATLAALHQHLGERDAAVCRELTKLYEECKRGTLTALHAHYSSAPVKGECVVLVHGAAKHAAMSDVEIDAALALALARLSVKEAVAEVTASSGRSRSMVYQRALALAKS